MSVAVQLAPNNDHPTMSTPSTSAAALPSAPFASSSTPAEAMTQSTDLTGKASDLPPMPVPYEGECLLTPSPSLGMTVADAQKNSSYSFLFRTNQTSTFRSICQLSSISMTSNSSVPSIAKVAHRIP